MTLLVYLFAAIGIALIAKWLQRPIDRRALIAFVVLPALFLIPGFLGSRTILPVDQLRLFPPWSVRSAEAPWNPNLNDAMTQFAPWSKAVRMAWKEGALPLRDRWNGCGMSLAANGASAPFSPWTFLMFLLPLANAFTLAAGVKLFVALAGMWLWLRELEVSPDAALLGSVAFSFSFTMTPWLLAPPTGVVCLWPWCLFLAERLRTGTGSRRAFWALLILLALLPLCGHVESVASFAFFWGLWLVFRRLSGERSVGAMTARIALAATAGLGISAFSLLPQVLAILASNRFVLARDPLFSRFFSVIPHLPAWPNGLLTTLFPRALGDAIHSPMIAGAAGSFPEMSAGYCGTIVAAAVLLALRHGSPRNRKTATLLAPLLFGLGVAIGSWPLAEIVGQIPILKMMLPLRFLSWVALAAPAVAAAEADRLRADLSRGRGPVVGFTAAGVFLAFLGFAIYRHFRPLHAAAGGLASQRNALVVTLLVIVGGILAVAAAGSSPAARAALPLVLTAITVAELLWQGQRLHRFGSSAELFPPTPLVGFLSAQAPPLRVVGEGAAVYPNTNVFAGVEDIRTHDPVERRDYVEFLDATCGYPPGDYFKHIGNLNASALDFLNVRFLVAGPGRESPGPRWERVYSGPDGTIFANRKSLPRIFATPVIRVLQRKETRGVSRGATAAFGSHFQELARRDDWEKTTYVLGSADASLVNGEADVSVYREVTNRICFRVRARSASSRLLVTTSILQDEGWTARDEAGQPLETALANGPFLAIWVPAGEHSVRLDYSPPGFRIGVMISLAALLVTVISSIWIRRRSGA
jgi:hypothetical protein